MFRFLLFCFRIQQSWIRALDSKFKIRSKKLTQQNWVRALDNKFSLLKAQKIYYKALTNFRICYKALKRLGRIYKPLIGHQGTRIRNLFKKCKGFQRKVFAKARLMVKNWDKTGKIMNKIDK
jgi:hypothetical protein